MTTDEVKKYLSSYYYLSLKVDSLKEELGYLEILANGTQGVITDEPRVQKSPSLKAPFVKYIDKIFAKQQQIDEKVEELVKLRGEIENVIASVDNPLIEIVLTYRYLNFFSWKEIANKLNYAISYIYELHRDGLWKISLKDHSES